MGYRRNRRKSESKTFEIQRNRGSEEKEIARNAKIAKIAEIGRQKPLKREGTEEAGDRARSALHF